jgi:hypothetical protein
VAHHLLDAQPVRPGDGDRLALGGQQPLVGVQADRVDADRRPLLSSWIDPGSDRSLREPSKTTTMSGRNGPGRPLRWRALLPRGDEREQFGDPGRDRLRVVADQRGAVLPFAAVPAGGSAAASGSTPSSPCPRSR